MRRVLLSLLAILLATFGLAAQSIRVDATPGKISEEELSLSAYLPDTTARAVYLVYKQDVTIQTDDALRLLMVHSVYHRIKILKENGKSEVDYKIPYRDDSQVKNIKVTTYNLVDGKVVPTKLDKKYIFRDKVTDKVFSCSFSAPEVRVGSVVEVSFEIEDKRYWDIPELVLQHAIPVNQGTVSLQAPEFLVFNRLTRGYFVPEYEKTSYPRTLHNSLYPTCDIHTDHFSLNDIPALPKEVSCMYPSQYRCAVSYELSAAVIPGLLDQHFSLRWEDVDKNVYDSRIVSQCQQKGKFLEPFLSAAEDELQAIAEVRCAVAKAVKWDEKTTLVPDNIRSVISAGSGSSASVNAIVASALNSMGYSAWPMLLRERSRGNLNHFYVRTDAFTRMVLRIQTPTGAIHYLDAAPDAGYPDLLDPDCLVEKARVIPLSKVVPPFWEDLTPLSVASSRFVVDATLGPDGLVKGTIQMRAAKEMSYLVRRTQQSLGSEDKYFELVEKGESFETLSAQIVGEGYGPSSGFSLEFEQQNEAGGDFLYIKPFLITQYHKSDFPLMERKTPVDFRVTERTTYVYTLTLPEGYAVEQLPKDVNFKGEGIAAQASCRSVMSGNRVSVQFSFRNNSLQVLPSDYQNLRAFWEQLCNIYQETIVLKKL